MAAAPRRPAQLCGLVNQNPIPYLISEAIFSNLGGTATMIGERPPPPAPRGGCPARG